MSEADLIDFTPELHKRALEIASHYTMGPLFTPPSVRSDDPNGNRGTMVAPGGWGAGNWNTGALDPETGMYYAISMTQIGSYGVVKNPDAESPMTYGIPEGGRNRQPRQLLPGEVPDRVPGQQPVSPLSIEGLPIVKPPYGRITAFDMNKGTIVWTAANGDGPRNHPLLKDLNLPPLGNIGRPAALVTKSLLFVGDASDAVMGQAGISGAAKLRAYDKATGKLVGEVELPVGATGGPMTYMAGGKQYIVVPMGGRSYGAGWLAFALP
jgi:quinoprotein glucose dehydrogenase